MNGKLKPTLLSLLLSSPMSFLSAAEMPIPTAVVDTTSGPVQGLVVDDIHTFKGLRYAAPPIGELRFMPPQRPKKSTARIDATDFGAPCMQMASGSTAVPTSDFGLQLKTVFPTPTEMKRDNEDCLFLNVWTPATDKGKRPVMVWFHGGGYAYGSGAWPVYDGENLARRGDAVVVTVNHRLNVFGYLHLAELLGEDYASSGNVGMMDLVMSLQWVKDNIERFGGDPNNVTIMGESGGGSKVSHLLAMPSADGLFHKAIIQSGPGLTSTPQEQATANAKKVLAQLDIEDAKKQREKLQLIPAEDLLAAAATADAMRFGPVVDGKVLPRHPFTPDAPEQSAEIPILIGTNKDEMTIFQASEPWFGNFTEEQLIEYAAKVPKGKALLSELRRIYPDYSPTHLRSAIDSIRFTFGSQILAERKAAQKAAPVYMYFLTWETPVSNGIFKSPHTLDMPLMFDNVEKSVALVGTGLEAQEMADLMSEAWISFARSGNPNTKDLPKWTPYSADERATMIFDLPPKMVKDPNGAIRRIMMGGG
ncbi:carboxylesterase/lipase family protein [Proteobacteria bacterium 005FR1]|nr:carboxylesterase/lipase family protein [Proteobacteria bacterium 005FR1]